MPATYTSSLRLTKPAVGDTNWGTTVNSGFTDLTDSAIAGYTTVSMPSNADYTLTSVNGAADEARSMMLNITSAVSLTTTRNVICPSVSKLYSIKNATTGGQSIVLKTSGGSGVTIPNGSTMILACNGTNVVAAIDYISFSNLAYTGTLTGGTGVVNLGSGQFYKDASGNVGIGSTSPVATLELKNAGFYPRMAFTKTSVGAWYVGGEGSGAGTTFQVNLNASNAVTIDSSLNVGIGTTAPLSRLDITSTTNAQGVLVRGRASDNIGSMELFNNVGTTRQGLIQGTASGFNIYADTGASNVLAFFTQATERARIDSSGNLLITGAGGLGYGTGSGGTVTQATSRTTGVTLNKTNGSITLVSAAGTTSWLSFVVNNSTVAATDTVIVNQKSGADKYLISVTGVNAGSFAITFATTGGTTTEQPVFNFAVIKAVAA